MVVRNSLLSALCVAGALTLGATASHAAFDTSGVKLIVTGTSDVIITFRGSDAGFTDLLFLDQPSNSFGLLFDNHATPFGATKNLGSFAPGTELIFRLDTPNGSFFTGPADRNPDGIVHAAVDMSSIYAPEMLVGFEDIFGGGDLDYNDTLYSFTNVGPSDVPEPGAIAFGVLAAGSVLGLIARKRKA